jgi:hypothetical protein
VRGEDVDRRWQRLGGVRPGDSQAVDPPPGLDIRLITILPGGGRTESEYARLLAEAGFRPEPAAPLARIESVMVAIPTS